MKEIEDLNLLIKKYSSEIWHFRSAKYNESQLRTDFIDRLFSILGWDITNVLGKPTNEREVLVEEGLKSGAGENTKKPDYTFRLFSERKFFVEVKKPNVDILKESEPAKQIRRYGFTAKLKISVLTNFEYFVIYDCSNPVSEDDTAETGYIARYHYTELVKNFELISTYIGRDAVYNGSFDLTWKYIEDKIEKFSVDNLFLEQINSWREGLASEIIVIKPEITEDHLNDLIQNYINSIVFLRVCEDRNLESYKTLLNLANNKDNQALSNILKRADRKYNSGLFRLEHSDLLFGNQNSAIWSIIKQLYYPQSPYSFTVFSSDILGDIYEIFLSQKIYIGSKGIPELKRKQEHIDRDVVTTPGFIVKEIVRKTVYEICCNKKANEILSLKFADIACGSGAFLLAAYETLHNTLIDKFLEEDVNQLVHYGVNNYKLKYEIKKRIITDCLFGIDKDYNAVKACSFGLLLKLLEDEDHSTFKLNDKKPILPRIEKNIIYGNSLVERKDITSENEIMTINPLDINEKFDVIFGNPPYMATEEMKRNNSSEFDIYKKRYKTAYKQFDKYFLFLERTLELLNPNALVGYILPSKFTRTEAGKQLRSLLSSKRNLKEFISFRENQVFKNKTTYTCLIFLQNSELNEFSYSEVTDISEFITRKVPAVTQKVNFEVLGADVWILEYDIQMILDKIWKKCSALKDVIGENNIANGIQTSANQYYIHKKIKKENGIIFFNYNGLIWEIEEELTRPYFETERGNKEVFYSYKNVSPNSFVIYPYKKTDGVIKLIEFEELKLSYPKAYSFILSLKPFLDNNKRSILPKPISNDEWYRYGRSQALENCDVSQKIIVGILSNGYKYSIDNHRTFVSSGGTAGYSIINIPENSLYSIYYIQALLNSKYLEWFASIHGEIFRGGFIARGTKVQSRMPIPLINFEEKSQKILHDSISEIQKKLNFLYDQIRNSDERDKVILMREFSKNKINVDNLLADLFDLREMDKLIPTVEMLYKISGKSMN